MVSKSTKTSSVVDDRKVTQLADMLSQILNLDAQKRPNLNTLLSHSFITESMEK